MTASEASKSIHSKVRSMHSSSTSFFLLSVYLIVLCCTLSSSSSATEKKSGGILFLETFDEEEDVFACGKWVKSSDEKYKGTVVCYLSSLRYSLLYIYVDAL